MPRRRLRVLCVEEEPLVRATLCDQLQSRGLDVEEAGDGTEALAKLAGDEPFDLLVTDIRMRGLSGWYVAEAARRRWPELRVCYVAGFSGNVPRPVAGSRFLAKPFFPSELDELVAWLNGDGDRVAVSPAV